VNVSQLAEVRYTLAAHPEDLFDDPHLNASGGLLDTILPGEVQAKLPRLPLPFGPERAALAAVFRSIAAYSRAPSDANDALPLTAETTAARTILSGNGRSTGLSAVLTPALGSCSKVALLLSCCAAIIRRPTLYGRRRPQ